MEKLHFLTLLYTLFLLQLLSLRLISSAHNPSSKYFINCGSDSSVDISNRTFVGDLNSDHSFSVGESESISNGTSMPDISLLYQTARIYRRQSPYKLSITENGTYLVRLHFFPFSSEGTDLADALFNVSTSNFSLLSNFSVRNTSNFPVIQEFFIPINIDTFNIYFIPAQNASFAFVNAIEVFILPKDFIGNDISDVKSNALRTIHRTNVGGQEINDSLWRNWIPDDAYVIPGASAKTCPPFTTGKLSESDATTNEIAPDFVYRTCKEVDDSSRGSNSSKIIWRFDVKKNTRHFVRVHFCNIVGATNFNFSFNIYNSSVPISAQQVGSPAALPFPLDWFIDSDNSGYIDLGIGLQEDSTEKVAFLNGVEIMEFVNRISVFPLMERHSNRRVYVIIGSVGGLALICFLIFLFLFRRCRRAKPVKDSVMVEVPHGKGRSHSWITEKTDTSSPVPNLNLKLKMGFAEIMAATQSFDPKFLIGEGGFGKVYEGTLQNGMKVAVKRSDSSHGQGLPEFQTEVMVLSKIRHRHLVSLIGYCDEKAEMILVYEFMEKGTLREHLYNRKENSENASGQSELTWKQRLEICIGSAKGLHYLHTGSDGGIIHRDVKSTNILLDMNYVAKVADFGLSQSGPPDPDHFSMGVKGSFGYLDPEYFRTLQLTDKSDVYSFGVVLLEVLCARPPIVNSPRREEINLAEWFLSRQQKGELEKIIDPSLVGVISPNSLRKFGEIAEKCLKPEGADRPTMLDVCWDLEYALQLQKTAVHREPNEDSTPDASSNFVPPIAQRLQFSHSFSNQDGVPIEDDDGSETNTEVFSQCRIDGAR